MSKLTTLNVIHAAAADCYTQGNNTTANKLLDVVGDVALLACSLRDMIDWLDDGNRVLSDLCAADVAIARDLYAKATGEAV